MGASAVFDSSVTCHANSHYFDRLLSIGLRYVVQLAYVYILLPFHVIKTLLICLTVLQSIFYARYIATC